MVVIHSMESILSIIIMISLGYILTTKGWFNEESSKLISRIVVNISLPVYMVENLVTNFDKEKLYKLSNALPTAFISILLSYVIGVVISNLIKIKPGRKGTFQTMFFASNTIFIGLAVNLSLFGEQSVPYVLIYYIANTVIFWTIGVYAVSSDSQDNSVRIFSFNLVKKIFSPPLLGFLVGIVLVALNVHLPSFAIDTCKYLGNLTTPLSMIFIGITIHSVKLREIRFDKDIAALLLGRFLISPAIVIMLVHYLKVPLLMKEVFVMQASMPVMTQTSIIAKAYNSDYKYAAVMTTITTLGAIITIPLYMLLLSNIQFFL
jgi:malate permease and related proteins